MNAYKYKTNMDKNLNLKQSGMASEIAKNKRNVKHETCMTKYEKL